jgi:hypothetical protein
MHVNVGCDPLNQLCLPSCDFIITCHSLQHPSDLLHIWFISCRMASVGLMHNLSKMMVNPYSAGDAIQLEMPAVCACMRTRHTKTYSDYHVYKSMNVPVL